MPIGAAWQTFLETPLINVMVALSALTFGSYGLAILVFTVITRAILFPLTLRMLNSMKALQEVTPQMQEIQKKYSDPRRRNEEIMKLYKEAGVNPLGCLGPQLIQMPLFIALYQVIRITLGNTPEAVLELSRRLYDVDFILNAVPLSRQFLWMDLGANGNFALVFAVFGSMWLQQRISTNRATQTSDQQRQMTQMMQWMLPALFAWFVLITPAGLGLYWATSTIIGLVLHWAFVGPGDFTWGSLVPNVLRARMGLPPLATPAPAAVQRRRTTKPATAASDGESETGDNNAGSGDERKDGRRGNQSRSRPTRSTSRSGRRRRHHRR